MQTLSFALELKGLDDAGIFEGYASVFGNRDGGGDIVEKGAFARTLRERGPKGVKMLADHDPTKRIGVWEEMVEDERGLRVRGRLLTEKSIGKEAHIDLKAGALDGLSIGYIAKKFTLGTKKDEPRRLLHEVDLMEISPVTFPANGKARVTAVKSGDFTERDFERWLMQDAGLTRSESRIVINQGFKSLIAMQDAGSSELAELAEHLKGCTDI